MAKAELVMQILVEAQDKIGMLAEISSALSDNKINIEGISVYGSGGKAKFMIITDNNDKVFSALRSKGYVAMEKEVVSVGLSNHMGALREIADKIKAAGINLEFIYGTTCDCNCDCRIIISSSDNRKVIELISG